MKGKYISWLPLYSIKAWGKFYGYYPWGYPYPFPKGACGYRIFQRIPTPFGQKVYSRCYFKPANPNTNNQQYWRGWFASGIKNWQNMATEGKEIWNAYNYPKQMSGFNRYLHYYLRSKR